LMDERDALALRLSELTGAKATVQDDGSMAVELNGQQLVAGFAAAQLVVTGGVAPDGTALATPISFALKDTTSGVETAVAGDIGGDLGATVRVLRDELPTYIAGLAGVVQDLVGAVNAAHAGGYDPSGVAGGDLFHYVDPDLSTFSVLITDVNKLAVSTVAGPSNDGNNAVALAQAVGVDDQYQRLVNGFGSKVASAQQLAKNQQALTDQVDSAREQMAGVSLDEETVNMISAQRAYEAAARVMTTLDSVLDTLINRTGLVR